MNINQVQGLVLIGEGRINEAEMTAGCLEAEGSGRDLCAVMVAEGRLKLGEAERIRDLVLRQSAVAGAYISQDIPPPEPISSSTLGEPAPFANGALPPGWDPNAPTTRQRSLEPALTAQTTLEAQPRSASTSAAGARVIGGYEVLGELGRGGMGTVYEAFSLKLKRRVALKTLNAEHFGRLEVRERFQLEAETMAQFHHPNIVRVFDFGEDAGQYYLAMDLVEGRSLQDIIEAEPLAPRESAALTLKVARALDYAHRRAVLHRDVKPDNILVGSEDGEPRLTDFGLAKRIEGLEKGLTRTGAIMGTPAYMAPEQANGEQQDLDQRADVYALGATLYAALTGRAVFESTNIVALMTEIFSAEPTPPSLLCPGLDRDLEVIVLKCLEKKPADRYYSASDLADDLQRYLQDESIMARPPSQRERWRRWRRRHRTALLALGSAALVALLFLGALIGLPLWDKLHTRRTLERARVSVQEEARRWRGELRAGLEAAAQRPPAERLKRAADVAERALDPGFVKARLHAWFQEIHLKPGRNFKASDVDGLELMARQAFAGEGIAARAALLRAGAHRETGDQDRAEAEQIRAFSLDPDSESGAAAILGLAERILGRGRLLDARHLFEVVAARKTGAELRARALYGLATIAIDNGDFDRAEALFEDPGFRPELFKDRERFAWMRSLARALHGRRVLEGPERPWLTYLRHEDRPLVLTTRFGAAETTLEAYRLDPNTAGKALSLIAAIEVPGRAQIQRMPTDGGLIFLEVVGPDGRRFLRWLRWKEGGFQAEGSFSMNEEPQSLGFIRGFGDFDGDGQTDLVMFARREQFIIMNAARAPRLVRMPEALGSEAGGIQCLDLDGDGCDELITAANEWRHFSLLAYRGGASFGREAAVEAEYVKLIGVNTVITRDPMESGRLLLSTDRVQDKDVGLIFGPDLSPQIPDAIWSLQLEGETWSLQPVVRWPFEDRLRLYQSVLGRLAGSGLPPHILYHDWGLNRPVVRTLSGSRSLVFRIPGFATIIDVDDDGEQELVFVEGNRFEVLGLGGAVTATPGALNTDESGLALLMLESGPSSQAEAVLELIADGRLPAALEPLARLAAAEAYGREKDFARARRAALTVAEASPALAREAYLLAAEQAELSGDIAAARRDLDRVRRSFARSEDEARRLGRRAEALADRQELKPAVTLDAAALRRSDRPLEVRGAEAFALTEEGFAISADAKTRAGVGVPIQSFRYGGSSLRASCRLRIAQLDYDAALALSFRGERGGRSEELMAAVIEFTGSGDPTSWSRVLRLRSDITQESGVVALPRTSPDQELILEMAYRPTEARVEASVRIGERVIRAGFTAVLPMIYDRFLLEVGPRAARSGFNVAISPRAVIRATVHELRLDAIDGLWGTAAARPPWTAGDALLRGDLAAARRILAALSDEDEDAWGLRALIALRSGEGLEPLAGRSPAAFGAFWRQALPFLGARARVNLRRQLGLVGEPQAMLAQARRHLPGPDYDAGLSALAFDAAGPLGAADERAGLAWHFVGDQARALELLSELDELSPFARLYAGADACLRGEYERALEFWKAEDGGLDEALERKRKQFRIFCQRQVLLRGAAGSSRPPGPR